VSATFAIFFTLASIGNAQRYSVTVINNCIGLSTATAINSSGTVAGYCTNGGSAERPFLWTKAGGVENLGTLGGDVADAFGINDNGSIVGYSYLSGDVLYHAFLWTASAGMQDLGTLGGNGSVAHAINNVGQVVGESFTTDGSYHAFIWSQAGGMQDLGTLPGFGTCYGLSINDAGQVVGACYQTLGNSPSHAFLWNSTSGMHDLGTLGGQSSIANSINSLGQITGEADTSDNSPHAFYWSPGGGMKEISTTGTDSSGAAISVNGQIVGAFIPSVAAFSWTSSGGVIKLDGLINHMYRVTSPAGVNASGQIAANGTTRGVCCDAMFLAPQ